MNLEYIPSKHKKDQNFPCKNYSNIHVCKSEIYIVQKIYRDRNNKYINIDIDINSIILDYKILCKIIYIMIFIINMSYII